MRVHRTIQKPEPLPPSNGKPDPCIARVVGARTSLHITQTFAYYNRASFVSSTTSYHTGGYANGRARFWWQCVDSAVQFLHPRIRPACARTSGHGSCPICPCWHPVVLVD